MSYTGCCLVCGAFEGLNDLQGQVAFRIYMQLLRVCYLDFFVGYSLRLRLRVTLPAYFAPGVGVVSNYNAACRHCVIATGSLIRIAVIASVTIARAAILLL